jgi:hypothetical protein
MGGPPDEARDDGAIVLSARRDPVGFVAEMQTLLVEHE